MAQSNSLLNVIDTLNPQEEIELAKLLTNPLIIKYFRIIGMTAVFEQASFPYNKMKLMANDPEFLLEMAYQKAIASMADTVLTFTPTKEQANGTSTT